MERGKYNNETNGDIVEENSQPQEENLPPSNKTHGIIGPPLETGPQVLGVTRDIYRQNKRRMKKIVSG